MTRIENNDFRERVGTVIRNNRLNYKMSQQELGQKTGLTRVFINQIENGKRVPSEETLTKIAACFNKESTTLFAEAQSEDIALALELKRIVKEQDHETLQKLIQYAKTLNETP